MAYDPSANMQTVGREGAMGSAGLNSQVRTFYNRTLLSRLLPQLTFLLYGQARPMPAHEGQTVSFRRFSSLALATTPLTEGITPTSTALASSVMTAQPRQYGSFVEITDLVDFTSPDPILAEAAMLLGEQAALTLDTVVRDVLMAGTNVQYAGAANAARIDVAAGDVLTKLEIQKAVRTMHTNKVRKITSIVNPSTGVGTVPAAGGFVGITGPAGLFDLKQIAEFTPVHEYGDRSDLLPLEVGSLDEVRFVMTHNNAVFTGLGTGGIDVHAMLILGGDAFGVIMPKGVENIVHGFGTNGDPLNQRMTTGWKAFFTAKILQDLAILRIEHATAA